MALLLAAVGLVQAQQANTIKNIVVTGNKQVSEQAILAAMQTKVGQAYVQSLLDQDRQTIEDLGFFSAVDVRAKAEDPAGWTIYVDVVEYPVIKEIRVVGNTAFTTAQILKVVTIHPGEVFNNRSVDPSSSAIRALYSAKGYFAQIDQFGPLKESPATLSISIIEATVDQIKIVGNTRTKNRVIRHLIKTKPGEPFNLRKWLADLKRLHDTQWFDSVKGVDPVQHGLGQIDLEADVKEAKTGTLGLGLQLDPQSSLAGFVRVSDSNFKGSGQSIGVDFLQATTGGGPSIDLSYGNPFIDSRDTSMSVQLYSRLIYRFAGTTFGGTSTPTNDTSYTERRTGTEIGFARPVMENVTANVSGRFERIKTSNLTTTVSDAFIQQDGDVGVLTLGVTRNRRDQDNDPARGDWTTLSVQPGYSNITEVGGANPDPSILGANTFMKANFEIRKYWSLHQPPRNGDFDAPRKVIAVRLRLGDIVGKVPFFEQYFAGGSETIRGYPEDRYWGRKQVLSTVEYRYPIQKAFNAIAFVDYGGAWDGYGTVNSYTQSETPSLHLGYGVGLSFKTPLGPIRLDLGFDNEGKARTHFLIGTSF